MGHLTHALGSRCGVSRRWSIKGISRFADLCEELSTVFFRIIHKKYNNRFFQSYGILFSHSLVFFSPDKALKIIVFLYDARFEIFLYRFYLRLRRRRGRRRSRINFDNFKFSKKLFTRFISFINKDLVRGYIYLRRFFFNRLRTPVHLLLFRKLLTLISYRVLKFNVTPYTNISIVTQSLSTTTARSIANYAIRKLRAFNSLRDIFHSLVNGYSTITAGITVLCSGRFTKRQRASRMVFRAGRTPHSSFSTAIDFCFDSVPLKYGVGSVKIWITKHAF